VHRQPCTRQFARGWLDRFSDHICEAPEVDQEGFDTGIRPIAHVGRKISLAAKARAAKTNFVMERNPIRRAD
jgi:hypothetical protein